MATEEFNKLWSMEDGAVVCLKHHKQEKGYLRCDGDDNKGFDWNGKLGGNKAKWTIKMVDENTVTLQNMKTEKFLRVQPDGKGWDCKGKDGGDRTMLTIIPLCKGSFVLHTKETQKNDEFQYLQSNVENKFPCHIITQGDQSEWSKPFVKSEDKPVVVIQGKGKNFRKRKDDCEVTHEYNKPAQWKCISEGDNVFKFKNMKGEDFLRIKESGDIDAEGKKGGKLVEFEMLPCFDGVEGMEHFVCLKSVKNGKFVGVDDEGNIKGFDEQSVHTRLGFFVANE